MLQVVRVIGFAVLIGAAGFVWVSMAPKVGLADIAAAADSYDAAVAAALADDAANNLRTTGAPQQQVVNGWTAKDLLTITAKQNADLIRLAAPDQRIPALLLIAVLAVCWTGLTSIARPAAAALAAAPAPQEPVWAEPAA